MRIIARKTLRQFVESLKGRKDQKAVKSALEAWFHEVVGADWKNPADVLKAYANASIVGPDRVVFNIKGNDWRATFLLRDMAQQAVPRHFAKEIDARYVQPRGEICVL